MIGTHDPARSTAGLTFPGLEWAAPPLRWVARRTIEGVAYMGGLGLLAAGAFAAAWSAGVGSRAFRSSVMSELAWMTGMALPLVALVNFGMGSFLSMQSYYGGTFVDGTGAVVGVGLVRNVGPLMAGLVLAGLFAARITPELRPIVGAPRGSSRERSGFLARTTDGQGPSPELQPSAAVYRLVAARLLAGAISGFVMSFWASAVGTVVGWQIGQKMVGVSTHSFFIMFFDLLWMRDVVGLSIKGPLFGFICVLFACHEGLWRPEGDATATSTAWSACRAACFSALAILVIGSGWFILFYHAGSAFGPTLLMPPTE